MKPRRRSYILLILLFLFSTVSVFAHSGSLDENGGHYNRKTGEYHYHSGENTRYNPSNSSDYTYSYNDNATQTEKNEIKPLWYFQVILFLIYSFFGYIVMLLFVSRIGVTISTDIPIANKLHKLGYLKTSYWIFVFFACILLCLVCLVFALSPCFLLIYDNTENQGYASVAGTSFMLANYYGLAIVWGEREKFKFSEPEALSFVHRIWSLLQPQNKHWTINPSDKKEIKTLEILDNHFNYFWPKNQPKYDFKYRKICPFNFVYLPLSQIDLARKKVVYYCEGKTNPIVEALDNETALERAKCLLRLYAVCKCHKIFFSKIYRKQKIKELPYNTIDILLFKIKRDLGAEVFNKYRFKEAVESIVNHMYEYQKELIIPTYDNINEYYCDSTFSKYLQELCEVLGMEISSTIILDFIKCMDN